ncbi:MAG: hypothetical protein H7175_08915 [Burkholderiales bacterium]|nr:hypothetical protein [Anaerolineae bacterium]
MSDYMLTVPEDVYVSAQRFAEENSQPVEQVMIDSIRTMTEAADEETELQAFNHLSDNSLWSIARERMPDDVQNQMQDLMDKNSSGTITPEEFAELEKLVERGQRLMVVKSEAMALLTKRGYKVTREELMVHE